MALSQLLIASSSSDRLAHLDAKLRNFGTYDVFLSQGDPSSHIGALQNRQPRAVILAPVTSSEAFQYLLLKRSITGQAGKTPTLVITPAENRTAYEGLTSVGEFELISPNLPDDAFREVLEQTLKLFDSHTELERTRANLKESELELRGLINTLTDGVVVTDLAGIIQRTNPAMCSLLGLKQSDIVGKAFETLIGDHEVIRMTGLPPLFQESHSITGMTVTFRRRDGSFLPLSLSGKPLPSRQDDARGFILVARDVRDTLFLMQNESRDAAKVREEHEKLKQTTDEKLEKVHSILSHSERLSQIGQLVAGIGHEINSPLHLIQLSLQEVNTYAERLGHNLQMLFEPEATMTPTEVQELYTIKKEFDGLLTDLKSSVEMADAGADRLMGVSSALRVQARRDDTLKEDLDLNVLLEQAITLLRYRLTPIELTKNCAEVSPVAGFSTHLTQVFTNILVNACDALEEHRSASGQSFRPRLVIETQSFDEHVQIVISDNGPGIPEDIQAKIFEDFFTTKATGKGTGIGLALSRKFIDDHGGTISVGTAPDLGGASFTITLPHASAQGKRQS